MRLTVVNAMLKRPQLYRSYSKMWNSDLSCDTLSESVRRHQIPPCAACHYRCERCKRDPQCVSKCHKPRRELRHARKTRPCSACAQQKMSRVCASDWRASWSRSNEHRDLLEPGFLASIF
ncbi:hypothetical protein IG631_22221 [Alternaria alternata]|nr:hypothetical protein IG631_22221 [Alternaria alternata]